MTVQLLKEQNKDAQMLPVLSNQLHRILLFADEVAHEIICEETDLLGEIIPRMFEVVHSVARYLCDYVTHGRWVSSGFDKC